ncbi:MAG: hypothetical protein M0Z95_21785 [Actinomycetota bacterium]|jgi:hypothetical protein|nr:hypothetical protein [Actinomycetota bacterium]
MGAICVKPGSFEAVRADPRGFCEWAVDTARVRGASLAVVTHIAAVTVLDVDFASPGDPALAGYPAESARVSVFANGVVVAVPLGRPERTWKHRYPFQPSAACSGEWELAVGALCLWYPGDPPHLRWDWSNGLDDFVRILQRHLWMEEYCRRNGRPWPVEDAPHGTPCFGAHPILTSALKRPA